MDEEELTRKAIEEIMREMNAQNESDKLPQVLERKSNPLRRPNKDFLDRTLNSVMTHNKRQLERNRRKCQNKLRDMDEARNDEQIKRKDRERDHRKRNKKLKRRSSQSSTTSSSSSDSSLSKERRDKHKKSKKLKKRTKKRTNSSSSSSSSLSTSALSISSSLSSRSKSKRNSQRKHSQGENDYDQLDPASMGYYVDPNLAWAAMAYNHMNQLMQQQQQAVQVQLIEELKDESCENDRGVQDIPSDLSLTYHSSESELNISLNSSSAEEDENGVLTFKLISDEEKTSNKRATKTVRKRKERVNRKEEVTLLDTTSESDEMSQLQAPPKTEEITVISSSSNSESDEDLGKREEMITTILSSSSSSEVEDEENAMRQEGITILSSSSDEEEEEELGENRTTLGVMDNAMRQEVTILSDSSNAEDMEELEEKDMEEAVNQNKVVELSFHNAKERETATSCQDNESEANCNKELIDNNKNQEEIHQTLLSEGKNQKSAKDLEETVVNFLNQNIIMESDAIDDRQDRVKMDTLDDVENGIRQGLTILNDLANTEDKEELKGKDLEESKICSDNQNRIVESPDNNAKEMETASSCQANESEANVIQELIDNKQIQEQTNQTLLSEDKDVKSSAGYEEQDGEKVTGLVTEFEINKNKELMQRDMEIKEISKSKHDMDCLDQPTSSSKVINSCLTFSDNEKIDNVSEAKVTAENISDINNLELSKRLDNSNDFKAHEAWARLAIDVQEKEKKITSTLERHTGVNKCEMGPTSANKGNNLDSSSSETSLISCNRKHLDNENKIVICNETSGPLTTENPDLETKQNLKSDKNLELMSEIEGKQDAMQTNLLEEINENECS